MKAIKIQKCIFHQQKYPRTPRNFGVKIWVTSVKFLAALTEYYLLYLSRWNAVSPEWRASSIAHCIATEGEALEMCLVSTGTKIQISAV
jgi:hypothetical protein